MNFPVFRRLRRRARAAAVALIACLAAGLPVRAVGPEAFPWQAGRIERARYAIEAGGSKLGEIEQILFGVEDEKHGKRYRLVNEMIRQAEVVNQQPVIGRMTTEIFFDPETLELLERLDNFAAGDTEARARTVRTDEGLQLTTESMSAGIPRPDQVDVVRHEGTGVLVDQMALSYFVRALPMVEGYRFEVTSAAPIQKTVEELRGRVGPLQDLDWRGQKVEVRRVEVTSPRGTGSFYVRTDPERTLLRYVSSDQEIYERLPAPAGEPSTD